MKAAALRVLLILKVLCLVTQAGGQPKAAVKCSRECKKFSPKIEAKRIISYHSTEASCRRKAIILVTLKLLEICADPDAEWVQKVMKQLDQDKAAASPPPHGVTSAEAPGGVQKLLGVTAPAALSQGTGTAGWDRGLAPAATTEAGSRSPPGSAQPPAGSAHVAQEAAARSEVPPEAGRGSLRPPAASPTAAAGRVSSQPPAPLPGSGGATGGAAGHAAAGTGADGPGTASPSPHPAPLAPTEGAEHPLLASSQPPGPPGARAQAAGTTSATLGSELSSLGGLGHATAWATPAEAAASSTAAPGKAAPAHTSKALSSSACPPPAAQQDPAAPSLATSPASSGRARARMPTGSPKPLPSLSPSSQLPLVIPAAVVSALMVCGVAVAWLYLKFGLRREEVSREMVQGLLYHKAAAAPPTDAYPMEVV